MKFIDQLPIHSGPFFSHFRYNISTDDYDPYNTDHRHNKDKYVSFSITINFIFKEFIEIEAFIQVIWNEITFEFFSN